MAVKASTCIEEWEIINIFKTRTKKELIHIVKKLKWSNGVNKIKNLTHLEHTSPLSIKKMHN